MTDRTPRTYTDGIGSQRCSACSSLLYGADGKARVAVRVDDLEDIACLLVDYVDCPAVWTPTIERIERAVGRTVGQMKAALSDRFATALDAKEGTANAD